MNFIRSYIQSTITTLSMQNIFPKTFLFINNTFLDTLGIRPKTSLARLHKIGMRTRYRPCKSPLGYGVPFLKGVVLKTLIKKPRKPNSGNRKCVLVRLSNGKEITAHVPGEGHNLQEHSTVLVRYARTKDVPGLKLRCVRGKYDLGHVVKNKLV